MKSLTQYILESTFASFGSLGKGDIVYVGVGTKGTTKFDIREITVKSANLKSNRSGLQYVNLMFEEPISEKIDKNRIKIGASRSLTVINTDHKGEFTVLGITKEDVENFFTDK